MKKLKLIASYVRLIKFELTLEKLLENNAYLLVAIGDFNAKLRHWYSQDANTFEGISVENVAFQFGLHQIIKKPTHILGNSYSCIDLVFTSQPNLIVDSGTHPSLHPNCHHQIIYAKFNLKIHYPLPYTREVWHYKDSNDSKDPPWFNTKIKSLIHVKIKAYKVLRKNIENNQ